MLLTLKDLVKDTYYSFEYLRCGQAYYSNYDKDRKIIFPIELADLGNATLKNQEKGLTLMRYIRKAMDSGTLIVEEIKLSV
jgi:hypothetical protein